MKFVHYAQKTACKAGGREPGDRGESANLTADDAAEGGTAENRAGIAANHTARCAANSSADSGVALRRGQAVASRQRCAQREQQNRFANYRFHEFLL